mmetsp:Transcript_59133/g.114101  ORF Transcript_59133/g.114101 Transcript_59133/m.114101 type:complete len:90 (-) Transcript_59133:353-622(-)
MEGTPATAAATATGIDGQVIGDPPGPIKRRLLVGSGRSSQQHSREREDISARTSAATTSTAAATDAAYCSSHGNSCAGNKIKRMHSLID